MGSYGQHHWVSTQDLQLFGELGEEWSCYIAGLNHPGISLSTGPNQLVWGINKDSGIEPAKLAYDLIIESNLVLSVN